MDLTQNHFSSICFDREVLLYFSIDLLRKYIIEEINFELNLEDFVLDNNVIIDYVFLCFLVGNDFLPALINLDINENSINDLVLIYIKILSIRKKYIITISARSRLGTESRSRRDRDYIFFSYR